ncbi:integrase catalytic domain-containing protein [Trichonephila clavipes]|nr:integrase catalytic domain-containing protein [Trichonephila clavipes]
MSALSVLKADPLLPLSALMGNLPRDRVVPDYPFNCSAIHIEIVSDLTSDAFIATLKRFFSCRGKCAKFYSDNGKTFVGANKELKRFLKLIEDSDDNLAGFLSAEGIEWKFIPPRAPSFGGLWEASVKSIKYHLRRVVSGSNLTYEEFLTVCIQIEGILNSRPLCPLSSNSDELNALTPAHVLIGRSMTSVVEPNLIELKENALKKWQWITRLVLLIWNKWHRCYLSELQQRNKWQFKKQNVNVGDLVVL